MEWKSISHSPALFTVIQVICEEDKDIILERYINEYNDFINATARTDSLWRYKYQEVNKAIEYDIKYKTLLYFKKVISNDSLYLCEKGNRIMSINKFEVYLCFNLLHVSHRSNLFSDLNKSSKQYIVNNLDPYNNFTRL